MLRRVSGACSEYLWVRMEMWRCSALGEGTEAMASGVLAGVGAYVARRMDERAVTAVVE